MKKIIVLLALVSTPALAMDYTGMLQGHPAKKMHECAHAGFHAANMTEDQHTVIHKAMMDAKAVMEQHKDGIHAGIREMMSAWAKHPIDRLEVLVAEGNLKANTDPVREVMRDSLITGVNVLSNEQRSLFNQAFMHCMHHGDGSGGHDGGEHD